MATTLAFDVYDTLMDAHAVLVVLGKYAGNGELFDS